MTAFANDASANGASAIYEGAVRHRRFAPKVNAFRYRVAMLYIDLSEVSRVFAGRWLWSVERSNFASFRRRDYMGPQDISLDEAVRQHVARETGTRPAGPIRMLTQVRCLGYVFNPVTVYFCFDASDTRVAFVVTDITNTPWHERHGYVFDARESERAHRSGKRFAKTFHVSPFLGMDVGYDWRFRHPGERLALHFCCYRRGERTLDATLALRRRPVTKRNLARFLWRYPLQPVRISLAIYWQALRLWLKGVPFHANPKTHGEVHP